jgi:hypothetical protein
MSQYRYAVQNDVLVRQKRKLLRFWVWAFNRSEEDGLNKAKNQLVTHEDRVRVLRRQIVKKQAEIDDAKKAVKDHGSIVWTAPWSLASRPVYLVEDRKKRKKKREQPRKHPNDGVIARITTAK